MTLRMRIMWSQVKKVRRDTCLRLRARCKAFENAPKTPAPCCSCGQIEKWTTTKLAQFTSWTSHRSLQVSAELPRREHEFQHEHVSWERRGSAMQLTLQQQLLRKTEQDAPKTDERIIVHDTQRQNISCWETRHGLQAFQETERKCAHNRLHLAQRRGASGRGNVADLRSKLLQFNVRVIVCIPNMSTIRAFRSLCLSVFACTPVHSNSPTISTDSLACFAGALTKQLSDSFVSQNMCCAPV